MRSSGSFERPCQRFAETCVIIDKLDKIGADEVKKELAKQACHSGFAMHRFKQELLNVGLLALKWSPLLGNRS